MNAQTPEFLTRSRACAHTLGEAPHREHVLEVHQLWDDLLLDTQHFNPKQGEVTIGSEVGWRWSILGVSMGWLPQGTHHVARYLPPMWSEVESDWRNHFFSPDSPLPLGMEHTLIEWRGEEWVADIDESWKTTAKLGGKRISLRQLQADGLAERTNDGWEVTISDDLLLTIDVGRIRYIAHRVLPGQRTIAPLDKDWTFFGFTGVLAVLGAIFGVLMWSLPAPAQHTVVDLPKRVVKIVMQPPVAPAPAPAQQKNAGAEEGRSAPGEKGRVGKRDAKLDRSRGEPGTLAKQQRDMAVVNQAGLLGALSDLGPMGGAFDGGLDRNLTDALGMLTGPKGTQIGTGGFHRRGPGFGNYGEVEGTGMGRIGDGTGGGCDWGARCDEDGWGKGDGDIGHASGGEVIAVGGMDRALIDEVVKAHMNQIRYCYQRELQRDGSLAGTVVIRFVIAKDGTVSKATTKRSTLGHSGVESCIEGRFLRMQYPEPLGGGIVVVSYPFHFAPGRV